MSQPQIKTRKLDTLLPHARAFYIIDESGILEHYEEFTDDHEDPDLTSAMFATVHLYAKQLGGGEIEVIELENHKFAFSFYINKLVVLNVDTSISSEDGVWLISQIMDRFDTLEKMRAKDPDKRLVFRTLFMDQGKAIDWDTIKNIHESALLENIKTSDIVNTMNLSKINVKSKIWIKVRQILSKLATSHKGLSGIFFLVKNKGSINVLFSGRKPAEDLTQFLDACKSKLNDPLGNLTIEVESLEFGEEKAIVLPSLIYEGALLCVISQDEFILERLMSQLERVILVLEKLVSI